jgi:hypothetical protein
MGTVNITKMPPMNHPARSFQVSIVLTAHLRASGCLDTLIMGAKALVFELPYCQGQCAEGSSAQDPPELRINTS